MLRNTLILPADNPQLAADFLGDAIADLDVILMLVFGGQEVRQTVDFADQLANKTKLETGGNLRRVVWMSDPEALEEAGQFRQLFADVRQAGGNSLPLVAVLNFHDQVRGAIRVGEPTNPTNLELLFVKGQEK